MISIVRTVIAREYLQRVRTRSFVLSTLALPVIMLGIFVVPAIFGARSAASERTLALVDQSGRPDLAASVRVRLEGAGFRVEIVDPETSEGRALEERLQEGQVAGALYLEPTTLLNGRATWRGQTPPSTLRRVGMQQAVVQGAIERRLAESEDGPGLAALLAGGGIEIERLDADDPDERERAMGMAAGFAGAFLLYVVLLIYGSMVLRAVLEEKTGRIVEIVLSSMRPSQLMLGKILGVGAVGLTQLAIWGGFGALAFGTGIPSMLPFLPEGGLPVDLRAFLPGPQVFVFFAFCFLLGYFLYASLFAAVGAMCSTDEEAQQLQFPVIMLVIIPIVFLMPVLENPNSAMAVGLSLFPFFSPILMFARVAAGAAPLWEALLAIVGMIAALLVTAWIAGRIYRTGILMQGKRPTVPELWRWIRAG